MKQRNHTFDFLCGLCILRMLMLHTISMCGYRSEFWFGKIMAWTFFFMSFFFFKAGYFNKTIGGASWDFCWDKAKRLLTPYIVWGTIGNIVYFTFMFIWPDIFTNLYKRFSWDHTWNVSHFYGNPPCWFLFSFFTAYIAMHFLEKGFSKCKRIRNSHPDELTRKRLYTVRLIKIGTLASFPFISYYLSKVNNPLWMSLNNVFMGVFFFYLGHYWHILQKSAPKRYIIAISIILIAIFIYGNKHWHGEYDMSLNKWIQNPWGAGINTACALVGISGLLLSLPMKRVPVIGFIGEHSMIFFVLHYIIINMYKFIHAVDHHSITKHWDDFVILMIIILCICTWLTPYIEKYPLLSGRFKRKQ